MKYIEIILKVAFITGVAAFFISETLRETYFSSLLLVSVLLGITLIFNKKQSYGYKLSKRDRIMRGIEGGVLVAFAIVFGVLKIQNII
jgi:hypothetical protein